jgi:pimeloyl-ACP methyl ester carboxylesterase
MTPDEPARDFKAGGIHIRDWGGAGIPVLLAHGMAAHSYWWDSVVGHWLGHLRPAAFDFRGHGDSDRANGGVYTRQTWIDDVETARAALGWEKFLLCGHSMGARIVLQYAAQHPGRLIGVGALDFLPEVKKDRSSRFARARGRPQPVYPSADRMAERFRLEPDGTLLPPQELQALGRRGITAVDGGFTWKFDWRALSVRLEPLWDQLPRMQTPALILRGEQSTIMSREDVTRVAAALPRARTAEVALAHHHVTLDNPKDTARAVLDFLQWTSGQ